MSPNKKNILTEKIKNRGVEIFNFATSLIVLLNVNLRSFLSFNWLWGGHCQIFFFFFSLGMTFSQLKVSGSN